MPTQRKPSVRNQSSSEAKTIRPNLKHSLESLWPSRFLKPYHLLDNGMAEVADTIKDILIVETEPRPGVKQMQPALYFERIKTPYLLATKADLDTLRTAYNVHAIGELIGLRVTIHVTEGRDGQAVLRIKPTRPVAHSATGQQIAQTAEVRVTDLQPHGAGADIATALDTEGNDHAQGDHITPGLQDQEHPEP